MTARQARRIGAALAVAVAVAVAACGPAADPVEDTAAPRAAETVGAVTTTVDAATAAPEGAVLGGVAAHGDTLVVAGAADEAPAVWTRSTATDWRREPVSGPRGASRIDAVAVSDRGGVAFGGDGGGSSQVWTRDDGTWRAAGRIDGRVNAAAAAGDRWVAVGDAVDPEAGETYEGVVWASRDGRTWQRIARGLDLAEGTVTDVAVADDTIVVVGFDVTGGRVWTSTDGGPFAAAGGTFGAMTMHGVAATSDGFVIVGRGVGDLAPRAWRSSEGRTWELLELDDVGVVPDDELDDAATFGDVVVVVGRSPRGGVIWALDDGRLVRGDA